MRTPTVPLGYAAAILCYPTCRLVEAGDRYYLELTPAQYRRLRDLVPAGCACNETPCWCGAPEG